MSMKVWLLLALASGSLSAQAPASPAATAEMRVIDTISPGKGTRYWERLDRRKTAAEMEKIFSVEGRPGVPPAEVAASVDRIWARLLAASPVPGAPTVYVADCGADSAESLLPGATRICWGYLRDLKTEDQVAAVLGHEMAHLILGHVDTARARGTGFSVLQGLYEAAFVASTATAGASGLFASLVGGNNALAVPTGWLDRANQKEELVADRLGIDLMVKAGFNAGGLASVFAIEGKSCGAPKQRNSPRLALMIDTSKRFTHPEDGKRACAAEDYVVRNYADAYDRQTTPLAWSDRKPGAAGSAFFKDVDDADRLVLQARALHQRLSTAPGDKAARSSCLTLKSRAKTIAGRHPDDRDLRRFVSAVALGCEDYDGAYEALIEEVAPTQRTVPGQFQALAISAMTRDQVTAKIFDTWLRQDFVRGLRDQKPSLLSALGLKSDAVDIKGEYSTFTCILNRPELVAVYDRFCNELYAGTAAAYTCSHRYDIKGVCASTKYFPQAAPIGPEKFLVSQSRWYAAVLAS